MARPPVTRSVSLLLVLVLSGCGAFGESEPPYEPPTLLTPDRGEYYSSEEVLIEWDLPEGAYGVDLTVLTIDGFYDAGRHEDLFDEAGANGGSQVLPTEHEDGSVTYPTPPGSTSWALGYETDDDVYLGFRVRTVGPDGVSEWTPIRSVVVRPLSSLASFPVELEATFDFVSERGEGDHSGTATSVPLSVNQAVLDRGYRPEDVRVVRVRSGSVTYLGPEQSGGRDFARAALGLVGPADIADEYPADVLADTYHVGDDGALTFYPGGGRRLNLAGPLTEGSRLRLAYYLRPGAPVGRRHRVEVSLDLDVHVQE